MKVSLIISTYNQPEALAKVLAALQLQIRQPDEVLIADDGSGPATGEVISRFRDSFPAPIHHHWHPDNGFLKTTILNKAVAATSGDYLVFLDGDCVPHPAFLSDHFQLAESGYWVQGRRCFVREPFVNEFSVNQTPILLWALRGRISRPNKSLRLLFPLIFRDRGQRGILGCNMAFWRADILAVNGFDEAYQGRGMGADSDLGTRVYNLGRRRKFVYGRALVYHLDHPIMPRPHHAANRARLDEVIQTHRIRCEKGLDQYLPPETASQAAG